jgi:ribosome recycling factor
MVVLNPTGDLVSTANYDTYGVPGDVTALATALSSVSSGNIVVLSVWDASAVNSAVRSILTSQYGSTNANTWSPSRVDHIFIGVKA